MVNTFSLYDHIDPALGPELMIWGHEFHNLEEGLMDIIIMNLSFLTPVGNKDVGHYLHIWLCQCGPGGGKVMNFKI